MLRPSSSVLSFVLAYGVLSGAAPLSAQSLYRKAGAGAGGTLIADHRATAIGDILTVVIVESHKVQNKDDTDRKLESTLAAKINTFEVGANIFKELPAIDMQRSQTFKGETDQKRDGTFETRMAVTVVDVLPNGNLVIAGRRAVRVDDEEKTFRISGVVRPLDVTPGNTVESAQVAEARVAIEGEGGNTRYNTRGPVGTFFETLIWALWPF